MLSNLKLTSQFTSEHIFHPVVEQALRLGDQLAGHLAGHQAVTPAVHGDDRDHLAVLLQYAFQFN